MGVRKINKDQIQKQQRARRAMIRKTAVNQKAKLRENKRQRRLEKQLTTLLIQPKRVNLAAQAVIVRSSQGPFSHRKTLRILLISLNKDKKTGGRGRRKKMKSSQKKPQKSERKD